MSSRNKNPAAGYSLSTETRNELRMVARYHGLASETAAVRWLASREARAISKAIDAQPKRTTKENL